MPNESVADTGKFIADKLAQRQESQTYARERYEDALEEAAKAAEGIAEKLVRPEERFIAMQCAAAIRRLISRK